MAPRAIRRKNLLDQFNFMVAGASRLGKSAFLRTFLRTLDVSAPSSDEPLPTPESFHDGPTTRINQVSMVVDEANDRFGLTMVDTPGFVDDGTVDEQCRLLITFLENQFDARLIEESRVKRNPKALHRQLHACLYFLDPSHAGLRPVDISVISSLCERVNVIPVIAKADTLTVERMRRVRRAIREDIRAHRLRIYEFPQWDDEDEELSEDGDQEEENDEGAALRLSSTALRRLIPFTIMSMEEELASANDDDLANDIELFTDEDSEEEGEAISEYSEDSEDSEDEDEDEDEDGTSTKEKARKESIITADTTSVAETSTNGDVKTTEDEVDSTVETTPSKSAINGHHDETVTNTTDTTTTNTNNEDINTTSTETNDDSVSPKIEGNGHAAKHEGPTSEQQQPAIEPFLGRRYPWGDVMVMDPTHCDVAVLRTLLLETQRRLLRDTTVEVLYERYRTERMRERRATMLAARRDARSSSLPSSPISPLLGVGI